VENGPEVNRANILCTKIVMNAQEFTTFDVENAVAVTFCMKELRAASAFCDFIGKPLKASFPTPQIESC
jgi:hypothetical protein